MFQMVGIRPFTMLIKGFRTRLIMSFLHKFRNEFRNVGSYHFSFEEVDVFELVECDGRAEVGGADVERPDRVVHARQQNSSWKSMKIILFQKSILICFAWFSECINGVTSNFMKLSVNICDMWQSSQIYEVTSAGPRDKDRDFWYCD